MREVSMEKFLELKRKTKFYKLDICSPENVDATYYGAQVGTHEVLLAVVYNSDITTAASIICGEIVSCNGKYTIDSLIDGFFMDTDNPNKEKYLGENKEVIGKDCQNDVDDLITKPVANTPGNIMDARLKALDSVVTKEESELYAVKDNDNEVFNQIKVTPEVRNVIESSIKNTPEPKINEPRVVRGTADRNVVQKPITVKKDPSESIIMKSQVSSNIKDGQKKKTVKQQPDAIKYYPESDNNSGSSWGEGW